MRFRSDFLKFALGVLLLHTISLARAQDSPTVPPWGRDLEAKQPSAGQEEEPSEHVTTTGVEATRRIGLRFRGEYLCWWTKTGRIPPLLTIGSTADDRPGALDQPFTQPIYGGRIDFEDRHGGRISFELPLGDADIWAASSNYLFLGARDVGPIRSSPGNPVLARPFYDVILQREDSSLLSYPGVATGSLTISTASFLHGAEGNLQMLVLRGEHSRLVLLTGMRYLGLEESIALREQSLYDLNAGNVDPALAPLAGASFRVTDRFAADNDFLGGQLGIGWEWRSHRWTFNVFSKVALGNVHESVTIQGRTTSDAALPLDEPAGLLALATNSGTRSRNEWAMVSEVGGRVGLRVGEQITLFGGYAFLHWNRVVRPGDQIDRNLNPNLIPTSAGYGGPAVPAQPPPLFRTTDWWAQGVTLGVEFRY